MHMQSYANVAVNRLCFSLPISVNVIDQALSRSRHQATKGQRGHVALCQDPFDHHSDPRYRGAIDLRTLAENGGVSRWFFDLQHHRKKLVCSGLSF